MVEDGLSETASTTCHEEADEISEPWKRKKKDEGSGLAPVRQTRISRKLDCKLLVKLASPAYTIIIQFSQPSRSAAYIFTGSSTRRHLQQTILVLARLKHKGAHHTPLRPEAWVGVGSHSLKHPLQIPERPQALKLERGFLLRFFWGLCRRVFVTAFVFCPSCFVPALPMP